jgi:hypothetical protein
MVAPGGGLFLSSDKARNLGSLNGKLAGAI